VSKIVEKSDTYYKHWIPKFREFEKTIKILKNELKEIDFCLEMKENEFGKRLTELQEEDYIKQRDNIEKTVSTLEKLIVEKS